MLQRMLVMAGSGMLMVTLFGCGDGASGRDGTGGQDGGDGDGDRTGDGDAGSSGDGDRTGNGDGDASVALPTQCERDDDCDDLIFCNGDERCVDGACRRGAAVECDDGIACTEDRCSEETRDCTHTPPDADADGHIAADCVDDEGVPFGDDCDDDDPLRFPGAVEFCDAEHRDEDCNPLTLGFRDADDDNFLDAACCNLQEDGELRCGNDCDDRKANVNPTSTEVCDGLDNNCDGTADEGLGVELFVDADYDGHGAAGSTAVTKCPGTAGYSAIDDDCDDDDPQVFLGQFEICDGKDNNCDPERKIDEVREQAPWFVDADGDGFGDATRTPVLSCYPIPGHSLSFSDCNDGDATVNPRAQEICDAIDNDCNGRADFALSGVNDFEDDDGDGVADAACGGEDCDDNDPRSGAGADEVCDRYDNDCDGLVDERTVQSIWYEDRDGDGWGVVLGSALASCDPLPRRAPAFGDCDDGDNDTHPGVPERCDGIDQDCDGIIDEGASSGCRLDNAVPSCRAGACAIYSCVQGFIDDDGLASNGCELSAPATTYETNIACAVDSDCDDGNLCNGLEQCADDGFCRLGPPINCEPGPTVVSGDVVIQNGFDIQRLGRIDTITGDVTIDSTQLTSLVGLENLRTIGGALTITNNARLRRLSGSALSGLQTVGGVLRVEDNPELISVDLPSLLSAGSIEITRNDALEVISGYASLVQVGDHLLIQDNGTLTTIEGFGALGRIGGFHLPYEESFCDGDHGLVLRQNYALTQMDAFGALRAIEGSLCIRNSAPMELELAALTEVGVDVGVTDNPMLGALRLPALTSVARALAVYPAYMVVTPLTELWLPSLQGVGYWIDINQGVVQDGVDLGALQTVGASNDGDAGICTGYFDGDTQAFTAGVCGVYDQLTAAGHTGYQQQCPECQVQVDACGNDPRNPDGSNCSAGLFCANSVCTCPSTEAPPPCDSQADCQDYPGTECFNYDQAGGSECVAPCSPPATPCPNQLTCASIETGPGTYEPLCTVNYALTPCQSVDDCAAYDDGVANVDCYPVLYGNQQTSYCVRDCPAPIIDDQ